MLDGSDNFEVRYLLNEACVKHGIPWTYGGVLGTYGLSAAIVPGVTPCLRCLLGPMPPPGSVPTCETAGILGTVVGVIAALEVTEGLKILLDRQDELLHSLLMVDVWTGDFDRAWTERGEAPCPVCDERRYGLLEREEGTATAVLCGSNAVQIRSRTEDSLDLPALAERLAVSGPVQHNKYLVRVEVEGCQIAVFADGRAIIRGTDEPARARALYARYVGV